MLGDLSVLGALESQAGPIAGCLSVLAFVPYLADTVNRRTKPQRASWMIWSVLGSIALAGQIAEGASASLWFAGVQVSGTLAVFLLSIWLGSGGFLDRRNCAILGVACFGMALWCLTEDASYTLGITIGISLLGGAATVLKAFEAPDSETSLTWAASFVASGFAIVAIDEMSWVLLAYPVYLLTLNGAILTAIMLGRVRPLELTVIEGAVQRAAVVSD